MRSPAKKTLINLVLLTIVFLAISISGTIYADAPLDYYPLAPLPGIGQNGAPVNNLSQYIEAIFKLLIGISAGLAVIMITVGGIEYLSTDAIGGKSEGRERIQHALLGLLLAISAWLILNTVNPSTLFFNFNPAPVAPISGGTVGTSTPINNNGAFGVQTCIAGRETENCLVLPPSPFTSYAVQRLCINAHGGEERNIMPGGSFTTSAACSEQLDFWRSFDSPPNCQWVTFSCVPLVGNIPTQP